MNVFNIPHQSDQELRYTYHALMRSEERNVPKPKYIPMDAEYLDVTLVDREKNVYTIRFDYMGKKYCICVGDNHAVVTTFKYSHKRQNYASFIMEEYQMSTKERQRKLRKGADENYYAESGKYKHLECHYDLNDSAWM